MKVQFSDYAAVTDYQFVYANGSLNQSPFRQHEAMMMNGMLGMGLEMW